MHNYMECYCWDKKKEFLWRVKNKNPLKKANLVVPFFLKLQENEEKVFYLAADKVALKDKAEFSRWPHS